MGQRKITRTYDADSSADVAPYGKRRCYVGTEVTAMEPARREALKLRLLEGAALLLPLEQSARTTA